MRYLHLLREVSSGLSQSQFVLVATTNLCLLCFSCMPALAEVIVEVSDDGSDLLFEWNGNLELGTTASNGTFFGTFNWMTPSLPRMHGLRGNMDFYDFPTAAYPPYGSGSDFLMTGTSTGDAFGVTIVEGDPRLYVPSGYTNQTLDGTLSFTGETMASQGIDLSTPVVYDFGATIGKVTFQWLRSLNPPELGSYVS